MVFGAVQEGFVLEPGELVLQLVGRLTGGVVGGVVVVALDGLAD